MVVVVVSGGGDRLVSQIPRSTVSHHLIVYGWRIPYLHEWIEEIETESLAMHATRTDPENLCNPGQTPNQIIGISTLHSIDVRHPARDDIPLIEDHARCEHSEQQCLDDQTQQVQ